MGNNLFGVDIAGLIKANIGPAVLDATLIVYTAGTRSPTQPTGGTIPTSVSHACKGFIDSQRKRNVGGTLAADGTKIVVLIGDTINGGATAPTTADQVTIEGSTYSIEKIDRDPDAATYTMQVRRL
jgi:hypothetical protein